MTNSLFIPKKIKVGYQNRKDTYTGKLAYVIYFDNKGVLRKEKSWNQWRDHKIGSQEFDNNPQDGFCLNKDVQRYNWGHYGSNRSYIRMYDPRGIEFEVTPENLIGILTETDCLKRGLEGKFVYAWQGTELILLPCCSEEYQKALIYTERQHQDISAKDLKPGCSYTTKNGEEVIYVGRFHWFEWTTDYKSGNSVRKSKKYHIFAYPNLTFFKKSDVKFLATLNSEDPVANYAEIVDKWNEKINSSNIENWEFKPNNVSIEKLFDKEYKFFGFSNFVEHYIEKSGNNIVFYNIYAEKNYSAPNDIKYHIEKQGSLDMNTLEYSYEPRNWSYDNYRRVFLSKEQVIKKVKDSLGPYAVLSSGKKIKVIDFYKLSL